MRRTLSSLAEVAALGHDTLIDVRSPSEYEEDHLPGAINLPALSDAERAEVGTIYVQESRFRARKIGAAMVARNVAGHLEGPLAGKDGGWRPLVYCWRGGQRSGSVATILAAVGWRVETLEGGYKSYRGLVVDALYDAGFPAPAILIDGNTGTAKTEILKLLQARGHQVIDLEGLANHRGSLLGARGDGQPSQKLFEGRLAAEVAALDPDRPVLLEAESSKVGERFVPPSVWKAMCAAPRLHIAAPVAARAGYLARAYADLTAETEVLVDTLNLLRPLQGHARVEDWIARAREGAHAALAEELITHHYDPRYNRARADKGATQDTVTLDRLDPEALEAALPEIEAALARISSPR